MTPREFFDMCRAAAGDSGPYNHHLFTGDFKIGPYKGELNYEGEGIYYCKIDMPNAEDCYRQVSAEWGMSWGSRPGFRWSDQITRPELMKLRLYS